MSVLFTANEPEHHVGKVLRLFRRLVRPAVIALLKTLPSPEGCGCKGRKEWMIRQLEAI